jgi:cell division protein FtsW (lipid II flippase)
VPALLVGMILIGCEFSLLSKISAPSESNVVGIGEAATAEASRELAPEHMGPREFCEKWTNKPIHEVDCLSGLAIGDMQPVRSDTAANAMALARQQAQNYLKWIKAVQQELDAQRKTRPQQANLLAALNARIESLDALNESITEEVNIDKRYRMMFQWLLILDGMNYDSLHSKFFIKRWDIFRFFDQKDRWAERGLEQKNTLMRLPWLLSLGAAILLTLAFWRARWVGILCVSIYLLISNLSLLISADAAMHFGENSLIYVLNPLGNQLYRQFYIQIAGYCIVATILVAQFWIAKLFNIVVLNQRFVIWFIAILIIAAYYLLHSPALGSEVFKVGLAILAASLMTDQGRTLHLINKYVPDAFTPQMLWGALKSALGRKTPHSDPAERVFAHIAVPLVNFTAFGFVMLVIVPLVFHDLGGSLIAALILITTLFLAFGARPALLSLGAMSIAGVILSQTEKVQGRIALMLDPMTAAVSDFARLKAFTEAAHPNGFGFNHIAWCNEQGTCLPLQVLSDYVPTILGGIKGPWFATLLFVGLCMYFSLMSAMACWIYLTGRTNTRMASMVAFFLLVATLLQTVITFFGNWRWIPLTGLGVPLIGIGVSTMLAPTLAIGLLLASRAPLHSTE